MSTIADAANGPRLVHNLSTFRKCASCAKPLPVHKRKGAAPKHCQTKRCKRIYYSGRQRTKCQRCGDSLARGRAAQRAAICGRCFVDLVDLAGGTQ